jgi:hypothetical protein
MGRGSGATRREEETGWKPILPIRPLSLAQGRTLLFGASSGGPNLDLAPILGIKGFTGWVAISWY